MTVLISILYSGRYVTLETNKTLKMKLSVVIQVYFSVSILKLTLYVGVKRDDDDDDDNDNSDDDAVVVVMMMIMLMMMMMMMMMTMMMS